ncbi:MAG: T9SS type B sorting domain-containing protein [Flavobacteriaceae bacterium]|nr:T9SS type B sorting domain-containing protein [Flavobacteriaceae bacterium]
MNFPTKNSKKFKLEVFLIGTFILLFQISSAQIITVNDSFTPQQLVENNFVEGCVEVSNISSSINGSVNGIGSYAYFERALSNFPFENGIVLTTGNATSGGNAINTNTLNEGETTWGTDADLETALGLSNTFNATSIEFDFVSISNLIQFNYILASEEYYANYPCSYSDGFAFLIKEAGTSNPYTNIALIPGTSIPVNTNTIHDAIAGFCGPENESYFDGYNIGDTNYNGRTNVLTASANIVPYVQYRIKLIIADQTDENFDSAVFIQGNSFNATVDLGPDITTCATSNTINGDIQNSQATYSWYLDGNLLSGETSPTLDAIVSGNYEVNIEIPLNDMVCIISDSVNIDVNSSQTIYGIADFVLCDPEEDGSEFFDLTLMSSDILNSLPAGNYNLSYHTLESDALNGTNPITSITSSNSSLPIFIRIEDIDNGCLTFGSFSVIVNPVPNVSSVSDISLCDDEDNDGSLEIYLSDYIDTITQGDTNLEVSFHYTEADAENGLNIIPEPYVNTNPSETIYAYVVNTITGCSNIATISLNVQTLPTLQNQDLTPLTACEPEGEDGFEIFDLTEVYPELLQGLTDVTVTFHETQDDAIQGVNAISDPSNFQNTTEYVQQIFIRVEDDLTGCASITSVFIHTNILITGTRLGAYNRCDDDSGDGIEDFTLDVIAEAIINDIENGTVIFYETEDDQINEVNAIDQTIPYTVTVSPHTLYVTLAFPGCEFLSEISLIIYPPLDIQPIAPINYCDTDDDGITPIDLIQFDDLFTGGATNLVVDYFATQNDAENLTNELPPLYTNTNSTEILYARVSLVGVSCFDIVPFELNVFPSPSIIDIDDTLICDSDQDGFYLLNLQDYIPLIVSSTTDLSFSFFNLLDDANTNVNQITNPTTYNASTESIFIRIENNNSGCYSIREQNIFVNTLPLMPTISDYFNCEVDGNQFAEFLFVDKDVEILNGQTDKQVLYFESLNDANNRVNIIDKNSLYTNTSSPQTIYVRVENLTDQECYDTGSFQLLVGSIPIYTPPSNYLICDDMSNDGVSIFDLDSKTTEIIQNSPEDLVITYHTTFEDADNETNAITNTTNYTNIDNPQQIFVRVENGTVCHSVASFSLNVVQLPSANTPSLIELCDDDYDETTIFDLTDAEVEILDIRNEDIEITYFETIGDLENNINQIGNPDSYSNIENPQIIQVRVENNISGCYAVVPLEISVLSPPLINDIPEFEICEENSGIYDLNNATQLLIDDTTDVIVNYFNTLTDAESSQNEIAINYNYTLGSQTLFIRADNSVSECFAIKSFNIIVYPLPIANTTPDLVTCDDDYDFLFTFDLTDQNQFILGSQNALDYNITYHELELDANNGINALDIFYEAFDSQTIFARIENISTGCYNITSFNTIINRKPLVEIPDQVICLDNSTLIVGVGEELVTGDAYLWSTNETTSSIEINQIGTYWVTVNSINGCETTTTFNVIESEPAIIETTEIVDFSDPNNVTITVSGIGDYLYQLDNQIPQDNGFFENVSLGYHTITIIDVNGCNSVTKDIVVIDAPKFFTPNGDTYFDTWHITGVEELNGTVINIYDRYGKYIKTLTWDSPGWNGEYNGSLMPATDYWFVANVRKNDTEFQVKGHFALKR